MAAVGIRFDRNPQIWKRTAGFEPGRSHAIQPAILLRKEGYGHSHADLHGGITDALKQLVLRRGAQNGFVGRTERGVD